MTSGKWVVLVLLALAGAASTAVIFIYHNAERLDDWLGRQVIGIANNHLAPDLAFGALEFHAPGIITLHDVTLTANGEGGDGTRVLDIARMKISLGEMPRVGRPLKIVALTIENGVIRIHRDPKTGRIVGLVPILDEDMAEDDVEEEVPGEFRLSSVMRLEQIDLVNLSVEYREGDGPAMELAGISTKLLINEDDGKEVTAVDGGTALRAVTAGGGTALPTGTAENGGTAEDTARRAVPPRTGPPPEQEPGWYNLDLDLGRAPGLKLSSNGRFNLDTFTLELADLHLSITIDPTTIDSLPPQLQTLMRNHNASGALSLTASGLLPLKDPLAGTLDGRLRLRDFEFAAGNYQFPIQAMQTAVSIGNGIAKLGPLTARVHEGKIDAFMTANLAAESRGADLEWTITGLDLNKFLRSDVNTLAAAADAGAPAGRAVVIGGVVTGSGSAATELGDPRDQLTGRGTVQITEGNLLFLPGLKQIADLMKVVLRAEGTHQLHAEFDLSPKGVTITDSEVVTEVLAARASGLIAFDGSLNIAINAGPLERLQATLGKIGDMLGNITDRLMKYRLRGTVKEPKVSVEVF